MKEEQKVSNLPFKGANRKKKKKSSKTKEYASLVCLQTDDL